MIGIVNYNMGNLASVTNAFAKLNVQTNIESNPKNIQSYDKLLLPGVGAFGDAMDHLKKSGMDEAVKKFASSGKPILGICLGMQLLFEKSCEFGLHDGLGLIEGEIVKFDEAKFDHHLKVPHMGWNELFVEKQTPLFDGMKKEFYLYFVHSFHVICDEKYIIGTTNYGYKFTSAVQKNNIYGFQPHPEKSHNNGLKILENFAKL